MNRHGQKATSSNNQNVQFIMCDLMRFLKSTIEAGGPVIDRTTFIRTVNRVGTSFQPADTIRSVLDPQHHAGAAAIADWGYRAACGCFRYSGRPRAA